MTQDEILKLAIKHGIIPMRFIVDTYEAKKSSILAFANAIQSHSGGEAVVNVGTKGHCDWADQTAKIKELQDKVESLAFRYHAQKADKFVLKEQIANLQKQNDVMKSLLIEARDDVANQLSEYQGLLPYKQHRYDAQLETLNAIDAVLATVKGE